MVKLVRGPSEAQDVVSTMTAASMAERMSGRPDKLIDGDEAPQFATEEIRHLRQLIDLELSFPLELAPRRDVAEPERLRQLPGARVGLNKECSYHDGNKSRTV